MRATACLSVGVALMLAGGLTVRAEAPAENAPDPTAFRALGVRDLGQGRLVAEFLSRVYTIDRLYRSMAGPKTKRAVRLLASDPPEWLWVTGYRAVMVEPDGDTPAPQQFMCHSNFDFNPTALAPSSLIRSIRLFTLSQGQQDIQFPEGFGIPVRSDDPTNLVTQVLNHNVQDRTVRVRHKVQVYFQRNRDLARPKTPLFVSSVFGVARVSGPSGGQSSFEYPDHGEQEHGEDCLPSASKDVQRADPEGRMFTGHWIVKPGRQINRTRLVNLRLPYDTTIHYIAVHLHPFAESIELRDLTAGHTLFVSRARGLSHGIGLDHVDAFSSVEGLPIFARHDYELVSAYNNTTDMDQDSMAVMNLYLRDRSFNLGKIARGTPASSSDARSN